MVTAIPIKKMYRNLLMPSNDYIIECKQSYRPILTDKMSKECILFSEYVLKEVRKRMMKKTAIK